jgi:hypothetical protein
MPCLPIFIDDHPVQVSLRLPGWPLKGATSTLGLFDQAVSITKWDRPFAPVQAQCWDQVGGEENRSESHATAVATMAPKTSALDSTSIENLWVTISQCVRQYNDDANVNMTLNFFSVAISLPTFTRAERNGPTLEPEPPAGRS